MHLFPILSSFTGGFQNFPNSDLHLFWKVPEIYRKQTHQGDGVLARWLAHSGGRKCHLKQTMRILEVWIVGLSVKNARFKTCRVIFQEDVRAEIPEVFFFQVGGFSGRNVAWIRSWLWFLHQFLRKSLESPFPVECSDNVACPWCYIFCLEHMWFWYAGCGHVQYLSLT